MAGSRVPACTALHGACPTDHRCWGSSRCAGATGAGRQPLPVVVGTAAAPDKAAADPSPRRRPSPPQACAAPLQDVAEPCKLLSLSCTVEDGPGSSLDEQTAAGSLFCIENSLEDCSSLEPESDEFSVYQSPDPLSLGPEGAGEAPSEGFGSGAAEEGGGGGAAHARAVLADRHLAPPPLASDPDLQEMLRQGFIAG